MYACQVRKFLGFRTAGLKVEVQAAIHFSFPTLVYC